MWKPIGQAPKNIAILAAVDPNDPDTYSMALVVNSDYIPAIIQGGSVDKDEYFSITLDGIKYFYDFSANESLLKDCLHALISMSSRLDAFCMVGTFGEASTSEMTAEAKETILTIQKVLSKL